MCSLVALAFLIPLGLSLREQSRDEAIADAARRSALVTGALAVSTDPAVVERAVVASAEGAPTRPVVHGLGLDESAGRAGGSDLDRARADRRSLVVDVDGGVVRLDPVVLGDRTAVVEVFLPDSTLGEGAGGTWLLLFAVGAAMAGAAVLVVDRVAARAVDSTRGLVKAALSIGDGDLGCASSRPVPASWPRPGTRSTGWPTGWTRPAPMSGNWSLTCRIVCVPR